MAEHISQTGERVDPMFFASGHKGGQDGRSFSAPVTAIEERVGATYCAIPLSAGSALLLSIARSLSSR